VGVAVVLGRFAVCGATVVGAGCSRTSLGTTTPFRASGTMGNPPSGDDASDAGAAGAATDRGGGSEPLFAAQAGNSAKTMTSRVTIDLIAIAAS